MPPQTKPRPAAAAQQAFLGDLAGALGAFERTAGAEGRATQRRLNASEYENALRDLFAAPWLQVKGQFPEDGEAFRYNKLAEALDVSHVHLARYMTAADYAIRQVLSAEFTRPPTATTRYYARDQRTLTSKFTQNPFNTSPDRQTYPVLGWTAQPAHRRRGRSGATRARGRRLGVEQLRHRLHVSLGSVSRAGGRAVSRAFQRLHALGRARRHRVSLQERRGEGRHARRAAEALAQLRPDLARPAR
jgi:hypothetical protein